MSLFAWILTGTAIGVLTGLGLRSTAGRPNVVELVVAVAGAVVGGALFAPLIGGTPPTAGEIGAAGVFAAFLGAASALAVTTLLRHRRAR